MAQAANLAVAQAAIEAWIENRSTTYTPRNILEDYHEEIIKTLKCHDDLVEACEAFIKRCEGSSTGRETKSYKLCKAAIAKVESMK